jgi:hypothetical protein
MKSSRIRFYKAKVIAAPPPGVGRAAVEEDEFHVGPVRLTEMPSPAVLAPMSPEQVVTDIMISTLIRVQQCSSAEVAAAAARYLATLR